MTKHDPNNLGDYTAGTRTLTISVIAIAVGAVSSLLALALLKLIAFFTNIFFFGTFDTVSRLPSANHLGWWVIVIPVVGALIVGFMARYGSERIRGHGIPEAIEAILMNGSRVEPKLTILKPLSSAIAIGSGGPFGAEGPIIMTGGAFGSMTAQFLKLTSAERKTLLVAGAAGGMSATFAAPMAAVLLAVELLLFEWKPRSLLPVAVSSMTAALLRHYLLGAGPLFATTAHPPFIGMQGFFLCVIAGLLAGVLSVGLSSSIYFFEDAFHKLPIHWMWWPAIGGVAIGVGGLLFPQALGVGYETIGALLQGNVTTKVLLGILIVKWAIWAIALGSGTSGGVLAPLLMIGGALGGLETVIFPGYGVGFWPMLSMAATLGGTIGCPLTAIVFALELTQEFDMLFPLMIAVMVSYGFTVMTMKRSILTEKVSRRGYHLSREYAVDPLEIIFVREVMRTNAVVLSSSTAIQDLAETLRKTHHATQRLFPVIDGNQAFAGIITYKDVMKLIREGRTGTIVDHIQKNPSTASPVEPLRAVVNRMATHGLTRLPVVDPDNPQRLLGMVSLRDLLHARVRNLNEEHQRERILRLKFLSPTEKSA